MLAKGVIFMTIAVIGSFCPWFQRTSSLLRLRLLRMRRKRDPVLRLPRMSSLLHFRGLIRLRLLNRAHAACSSLRIIGVHVNVCICNDEDLSQPFGQFSM